MKSVWIQSEFGEAAVHPRSCHPTKMTDPSQVTPGADVLKALFRLFFTCLCCVYQRHMCTDSTSLTRLKVRSRLLLPLWPFPVGLISYCISFVSIICCTVPFKARSCLSEPGLFSTALPCPPARPRRSSPRICVFLHAGITVHAAAAATVLGCPTCKHGHGEGDVCQCGHMGRSALYAAPRNPSNLSIHFYGLDGSAPAPVRARVLPTTNPLCFACVCGRRGASGTRFLS